MCGSEYRHEYITNSLVIEMPDLISCSTTPGASPSIAIVRRTDIKSTQIHSYTLISQSRDYACILLL